MSSEQRRRRFAQSLLLPLAAGVMVTLLIAYGSLALVELSGVAPQRSLHSYDGHEELNVDLVYGWAGVRVHFRRQTGQAWCVDQACGPPDSPGGGDQRTAWATDAPDAA